MPTPVITVQYLEDSPQLSRLEPTKLVSHLQAAFDRLPFTHLLVGWHLPAPVLEALRLEAEKLGLRFLRWQPLLAADRNFEVRSAWYTDGLEGHKVLDRRDMPEFNFFCPNHPEAREAIVRHIHALVEQGLYHGFFLDRVRFPSPSIDPLSDLSCFCEYCCHKAGEQGLDLRRIRQDIQQQATTESGAISLVRFLLSPNRDISGSSLEMALSQLIRFRQESIAEFFVQVSEVLKEAHLEIGLDCFSPSVAAMVGQDVQTMGRQADWVKVMTYAHTNAPAGLPYELGGLAHFLEMHTSLNQAQALQIISKSIDLPLPVNCQALQRKGLQSTSLGLEVRKAIRLAATPVLAGVELVDLPGVTALNPAQIHDDLAAIKHAVPAGLAISWDLMHIPLDWLALVRQVYLD